MHDQLFQLLKQEHDKVKGIISQILENSSSSTRNREDLFNQLKKGLLPHMKGEENSLYPALERHDQTKMYGYHAEEEHHIARQVLHDLDEIALDDERWISKMEVLQQLLITHINYEENQIFKVARQVISEDEIHDILTKFQEVSQKVLIRA